MSDLAVYERLSRRVSFAGANGYPLAGIIDSPQTSPLATVLFSHCFTCNKDLKAIVRISRRLAELGIAVLRYDWTGLGGSEGHFSETTFSSGVADLKAAAFFCASELGGPHFLLGYSLGGAASLAVASEIDTLTGVLTIGAPSDTYHLADLLERMDPQIVVTGSGSVSIGGRRWQIGRRLIEDLRSFDLQSCLDRLDLPVFLIHSLVDETVDFWHALRLFSLLTSVNQRSRQPISLLSLPNADHLLSRNADDLEWVSQSIARWIFGVQGNSPEAAW